MLETLTQEGRTESTGSLPLYPVSVVDPDPELFGLIGGGVIVSASSGLAWFRVRTFGSRTFTVYVILLGVVRFLHGNIWYHSGMRSNKEKT